MENICSGCNGKATLASRLLKYLDGNNKSVFIHSIPAYASDIAGRGMFKRPASYCLDKYLASLNAQIARRNRSVIISTDPIVLA